MKIMDAGVFSPSFMDFTLPSPFAIEVLYYVPQFGHFYCGAEYSVQRETLDLYLLVYVKKGSLCLKTKDKEYRAEADQILLLDCHHWHRYYCDEKSEFYWFHFNGRSCQGYVSYLYENNGPVFSGESIPSLLVHVEQIFHYAQAVPSNEHLISVHVTQILGRLAVPFSENRSVKALEPAITLIRQHYMDPVTIEELAETCNMSRSHFIRVFSRSFNRTPHEYLVGYRLRKAKQLLLTTDESMEFIAEQCGFNSGSHFARAFRQSNGLTPGEFRALRF